ncbi:ankyrin repeat protein SKIP35 [Amborella trichopoda]|uniref:Ankyrin repeat protein SKIP35 n=1 Tax=Amborella trichopoda TaxID=13333 RepID=U5DHY4_AMBTC|nr:ankyrin repeat protein SKIP35 [Amborella trichopoda]ERN20163.1 hypothetical protein AMTR_s00066p00097810 [Amborella trichopoda]|eukprot:XP_006858696.1 ankyrin repeat protein SKIP35 [Amborella trichopoda]
MEEDIASIVEMEDQDVSNEAYTDSPKDPTSGSLSSNGESICSDMEISENQFLREGSERGEGSNVVFCKESHLSKKEQLQNNFKSEATTFDFSKKDGNGQDRRLNRQERIELGRIFQGAMSSLDWERAESLLPLVDTQTLNDLLCIALDSIWFLSTEQEIQGASGLIERIILSGAYDFTRAALRTSFLASCVSACRSRTMNLADTVTVMAQRLRERLQECNGDEVLKAEAGAKVQKFTEWALKCIGSHSRSRGDREGAVHNSATEIQLQLSAFGVFLDLAGHNLTGKDFSEAFDAACFPLTLFSSSFDPGWASGISATAIRGLLGMLVEGGADNVNQCFLEASRFGSTELVRILLQIAQRNSLDVDVDLALGFAAHYGKIGTMECLVDEGHASAFLGPLMRAAERGCAPVVQWFVGRGCRDMELCLALTAAASAGRAHIAALLLPLVPGPLLQALSTEILKAAGAASLEGITFLLQSNFLGSPEATYTASDIVAKCEDEGVKSKLKEFLIENWSEEAFMKGREESRDHYVNVMRVVSRGGSELSIGDLPVELRVGIAYLPLYRECVACGGKLLSQRLRGQVVEAVWRLGAGDVASMSSQDELLTVFERHLPPFLIRAS